MDPYKILGVSRDATQAEIKAAYRKLAKKLHPDLNPGKKDIEAKFKEINNAYDKIETAEARAKFDTGEIQEQHNQQAQKRRRASQTQGDDPFYYSQTQRPGSRYSQNFQGFDPSQFADIFGQQNYEKPDRTEDSHYSLNIDFKTSILGGEQEIVLPSGKKLLVKIPPGIKSGSKLRLTKQGEPNRSGTANGVAYIEIQVLASPLYIRKENDLEVSLPLSISEAILGGDVKVSTIDGPVMLHIPKGLTTGSRVRMKGKGVPNKEGRGDQYAVVTIVMPSQVDTELELFMKEWSKTHTYNPRESQERQS